MQARMSVMMSINGDDSDIQCQPLVSNETQAPLCAYVILMPTFEDLSSTHDGKREQKIHARYIRTTHELTTRILEPLDIKVYQVA
jgi:hypothetical protein